MYHESDFFVHTAILVFNGVTQKADPERSGPEVKKNAAPGERMPRMEEYGLHGFRPLWDCDKFAASCLSYRPQPTQL